MAGTTGCDGNPRHTPIMAVYHPPVIPAYHLPVIPVKTGIHASGPTGEQECPSSPPHSRENGNPRVRPDRGAGMPVIPPHSRENGNPRVPPRPGSKNARHPPVIPVKTGIHGSAPAGAQECPSSPRHSRENGNPRVRPDRGAGMPVIPPSFP